MSTLSWTWPCVGILGGSGPLAASALHMMFLRTWQAHTRAVEDWDFPELRVRQCASIGLSGLGEATDQTAQRLREGLDGLRDSGAQVSLIACNTLHSLPDAQAHDVWSLVRSAVGTAQVRGAEKIAVWCSKGARDSGVYATALKTRGLEMVPLPLAAEQAVDALIRLGMSGRMEGAAYWWAQAWEATVHSGAEALILGCTELPLAAQAAGVSLKDAQDRSSLYVVDAGQAACESLIRRMLMERAVYEKRRAFGMDVPTSTGVFWGGKI